MKFRLSDFDYELDEGLIAQAPSPDRGGSRLMVLGRNDRSLHHHDFRNLPDLLRPGDLLVVNDTRVIPARFHARRDTGGRIEGLFLSESGPGAWQVMLKGAGRCRAGEALAFTADRATSLRLQADLGRGRWRVAVSPPLPAAEILDRLGAAPLPPYIRRPNTARDADDRRRYQTVYASVPGAVAAPTAGLHFTSEILQQLDDAGVRRARVTLHVGLGTFEPVRCENLADHRMRAEWYDLPPKAAALINAARDDGRRVVAVGTTSVRVLEAAAPKPGDPFTAKSRWTDLFLYPPAEFHAVDAMITNFHLPKSTLLMLVAAFCDPGGTTGLPLILDAYAQAAKLRYRFYSYGDAMLIQ